MRTLVCLAVAATVAGWIPPAAPRASAVDVPYAVRKDTWFETAIASREALARPEFDSLSRARAWENVRLKLDEWFPDPLSVRERRLEEQAGLWSGERVREDWAAFAARYAAASGDLANTAGEKAAACRDVDGLRAVRDFFYVPHARRRLELAERTLGWIEGIAPRPELAERLRALKTQADAAAQGAAAGEALYAQACELRRRIVLSHPGLDFPRLLINKRSGFLPEHMCDQYLGRFSQVAPGLVVLDGWKDHPRETVLLEGKLPAGGLIQPDLSFDGQRVVFAFADPTDVKDRQLLGYSLYEYSFGDGAVRRITGGPADPREGLHGRETAFIEDLDPCYLPDGGLAFISTRSQQYGRCHGSRYVPSYTLYRGEADGSGIRPLSFNESNEWAPDVLPDGSIVYCRWDYVNRHDTIFQSLWTIRPDGTQTAHYYGNSSRAPCMISEPRAIPGSRKTVSTACAHHGQSIGTLVTVDPWKGQENGAPLAWITPEIPFPESGVPEGIAKSAPPPPEDAGPEPRASTPWPIDENLFLCTYRDGAQYAVYLVDTLGGRERIHRDPAVSCFDPIPLRPRPMPPVLPAAVTALAAGDTRPASGVFAVQDVYASTQPIPRGTVKRMRINRIISQPTRSVPQRSAAQNELVKQVLGTVPVNADGSVAFEAPACEPLQFQLLDADGTAVMTMRSLVYLQPGERAACVGCHENRLSAPPPLPPHPAPVRLIEPPAGPRYDGGLSFARTVQPVLDRYCLGCHGPDQPARGIDLAGGFDRRNPDGSVRPRDMGEFSVSYESLVEAPGMVRIARRNSETAFSRPMDYFARAGKLAPMLLAGHPDQAGRPRVQIDRDSFQRVADWLDLNAQYYGDYSHNRLERQPPAGEGEKALRDAIAQRFGDDWAKQPFPMLVNVANPAESRILMAPLPTAAGGWGQVTNNAFSGIDDPAFVELRRRVEASIEPLKYRDIAGTCGRDRDCVCGACWARKDLEARRPRVVDAEPAQ